ncbi:hypothetical protein KDN34_13635 [Shewanella yunxiaonensis]|uniref:Orphan protein n=1 Tax=Shewanella yunxiaonensis TaxID=2829809 RepID=A0ABX7YRD3_9GAMM|nr:hypothetical protein [Shewanella yunxiaonensis]QUN05230.1 hypothetical protein KDN34_13635 [Shewanella yunxiaonensis]
MNNKILLWILAILVVAQGIYLVVNHTRHDSNASIQPPTATPVANRQSATTANLPPITATPALGQQHSLQLTVASQPEPQPEMMSIETAGVIDAKQLQMVLASEDFHELTASYANANNKSLETGTFESQLNAYLTHSPVSNQLSDYQIGCDDRICWGYMRASDRGSLEKALKQFAAEAPLHSAGYFTAYEVDQADAEFEYRFSFNADPHITSIKVEKSHSR